MSQISPNSYVTESTFNSGIQKLDEKIQKVDEKIQKVDGKIKKLDERVDGVDGKIGKVALALLRTQKDVEIMKENMSTKSDIEVILNRIDHFSKKIDVYDKKSVVHDYRLNEIESSLQNHDKRIAFLERR